MRYAHKSDLPVRPPVGTSRHRPVRAGPAVTATRLLRLAPRLLFLVGGTALGVVLLVLLLRSVDLGQLGNAFSRVDYAYLALAIVPFLVNLLVKVPRWGLLFGADQPKWDTLFGAMNVGYAVNSLVPVRLGELVRAYWIRDRTGLGMVRTLSTIAVERITDGVAVLLLLFVTAPTVAFPGKLLGPAITVGVVLLVAMTGIVVLVYTSTRENHPLSRLLDRLEHGRGGVIARALRQAITGLGALRHRRALSLLLLYTVLIWASNSLLLWLVLRAFHIEVPLTAGVLITAVLNLGMAVPSSPGYVGVFDYLMVLMLALYHVAKTPAVAASLAFHAIAFVPVTIIGIIYLARTGLQVTLRMLRTASPPG